LLPDVHTPAQRSYNMSMIRCADTRPEVLLRKALWRLGFRYRLLKRLPGRPDLVFPRFKAALFIDGCFWHGCPKHFVSPQTNASFWKKKIVSNVERDAKVNQDLRRSGWLVIRVWEHEIRHDAERCALRIGRKLSR
jgi:DNA mismatch endonuclease, patch repair protein